MSEQDQTKQGRGRNKAQGQACPQLCARMTLALLLALIILPPRLALSDGLAVTDLVTRYSMIRICAIYDHVSADPSSADMLDALDAKIRAEQAQLDLAVFSKALEESMAITSARTEQGRIAPAYTATHCPRILVQEAAAFRNTP
ncbi:hypothetical protein [uncultured Tateyamaria sp.]|uniref:hypothetical protein n=1 Tax=uncultured Tateyamaria sp. TaxID=455651 RepID=UPI00260CCE3A|nr:hypothetical protein [uncultured Tateyamaria sp.]